MRFALNLLSAFILTLTGHAALADSIQLSVNSSFSTGFVSPNDNYWGTYSTFSSGFTDFPSIHSSASVAFSSISLFIPEGDTVTSATLRVLLPTGSTQGTGVLHTAQPYGTGDFTDPIIAPTFSNTGTSDVYATLSSFPRGPIVNGNEISTGDLNLLVDLSGTIRGAMITSGSNWAGYISGDGEVVIPYTVELDVTYTPEPSSIALSFTGMLGLVGLARRRLFVKS